jgi:hypothetical protein
MHGSWFLVERDAPIFLYIAEPRLLIKAIAKRYVDSTE